MENRTRVIAVVALAALAVGALVWSLGGFTRPVGKEIGVEARCRKCNAVASMDMAHVLRNGFNDPEHGWHIKCTQCGDLAPVRTGKAWDLAASTPPAAP